MSASPSGEQWTITHGDQTATIVEVGGGLRSYRVGGVDIVAGYRADEPCSSGRGQLLLPWPNRIRDGRYRFDGVEQQLALTEPARGNASHGLVRWTPWSLHAQASSSLTVGCRLHPQPGWPGTLDLTARYELADDGLTVTIDAANVGSTRVPFGCGAHPYVAIGDAPRAGVELTIPARSYVQVDQVRKLPTATVPLDDEHDFRAPRPLADLDLDTAFGDLDREGDGRWRVDVVATGDRPAATVWGDEAFGWVQVFTDKAADEGVDGARGIAVEPLTCPPDAFNSGEGLAVLAGGERWSGSWGIHAAR